ncbi:MAG: YceI family protein [Gemmatimonadota bacterium]
MTTRIQSGTYQIDATHSSVEFAVKHLMISTVRGRFSDVKGTLMLPESGDATVDITIGAQSISTGVDARDTHLRSADFFDVEKFPELRFVSTHATRHGDGWGLEGNLTMHGVTNPVTLAVTEEGAGVDPWGNQKVAFSATGKLNRTHFGLTYNAALETGGVLVGEEIKLSIDAQLVKQAAKAAA